MITNKDVRVENGNLVLNGDKYPLDGQSPEAIMAIVEDNSDTTPTEDSTAPVQSGGVYSALSDINTALTLVDVSVTDGENSSVIGVIFNGLLIFTGTLLNTTTTANTWITTNMTHNMTLTKALQVAIWSAATGDWAGFSKFEIDGSVKVYGKYNGNFSPNLIGAVKL